MNIFRVPANHTKCFDEKSLRNKLIAVEKNFERKQIAVNKLNDRLIALRNAVQERLKERIFYCEVCLVPVAKSMLLQHICCENVAFLPCAYCNELFSSTKLLVDHLEMAHKDGMYIRECQTCQRTFCMALLYDFHQDIAHVKPPEIAKKPQIDLECTNIKTRKVVIPKPQSMHFLKTSREIKRV